MTIVARARNVGATTIGDTTPNTGSLSWLPNAAIGAVRTTVTSNSVTATVREPAITITKDENDADDIVDETPTTVMPTPTTAAPTTVTPNGNVRPPHQA